MATTERLPEIVDRTVGLKKKNRRFTYIPEAHFQCPQATIWSWVRNYGRVSVLPLVAKNCGGCPIGQAKQCQALTPLGKFVANFRQKGSVTSQADADCLAQFRNFLDDNKARIDAEAAAAKSWKSESAAEIWIRRAEAVEILGSEKALKEITDSGVVTPMKSGRTNLYRRSEIVESKPLVTAKPTVRRTTDLEKALPETTVDGIQVVSRFRAAELMGSSAQAVMGHYRPKLQFRTVEFENGLKAEYVTVDSIRALAEKWPVWKRKKCPLLNGEGAVPETGTPAAPAEEPDPYQEAFRRWPFLAEILAEAGSVELGEKGIFSGMRLTALQRLDEDFKAIREWGFSRDMAKKMAAHLFAWLREDQEDAKEG